MRGICRSGLLGNLPASLACRKDTIIAATVVSHARSTFMNEEQIQSFDESMDSLKESLTHWANQAQQTDRDDILSYIHGKCQENIQLLGQGIEIAREDDDVDLGRWADLLWMFHYHHDLMHYCVNKGATL